MTRSAFHKRLSGTTRDDRTRRLNGAEVLQTLPPPPNNLPEAAHDAWRRLGALAIDAGTLTRLDVELLDLCARTASTCDQLERQLTSEGFIVDSRGALKCNPAANALDRSRGLLFRLLTALGLVPAAREKLSIQATSRSPNKFDALERIHQETRHASYE